ncbi:hypothetical protein CCICO_08630 [Corynebacterium ciconiae DSM 44920]|nr:hypothetical protein CCICO_08630 [Corynebacterium ciconiae DSM 44920]
MAFPHRAPNPPTLAYPYVRGTILALPTDLVESVSVTDNQRQAAPHQPQAHSDEVPEGPLAVNEPVSNPHPSTVPPRMTAREFTLKVLNGISIAVVVALVPQALLGALLKALLPVFPLGGEIITVVSMATSTLPLLIGVLVAMQFTLTPIQTAAVGIAAMCGSGVATVDPDGGFHLQGTGLVINTGLTAALAVGLIYLIGDRLKNYTILLLSTLVTVIAGGIGWIVTYPLVKVFTEWLGGLVNGATGLQPILMGIVLAMIFAAMIVSPVSTVGLATAIMMDGVAAGTANLGVVAAGFGLMIAGWRANGVSTALLHVLGSPKVQMANAFKRPVMMVPILAQAAVLGAIGGAIGIAGTPISAGFGISGLVGPLAAYNTGSSLITVVSIFFIAPVALSLVFTVVFHKLLPITSAEDYALEFD